MVEPGRTCLGGRYELRGLIAAGGMGQVWRGVDVLLGRPVAVKVLRSEFTGDPTFVARFRAEAQNAAALSHPRIAAVYDYGETTAEDGSGETLAYLVMELVEGEPLSDLLRRSGRLDTATTLRILGQTAAGLAEAHRAGMVHRDVKPGNILVTPDGDVKITDFGIAWSARSVALTRTGQVLGTPQYLSPEQAEGRQATPASDVYALGLIGYECLTGHPAFDGENAVTIALKQVREEPEPLPEDLPARIRSLVRRALVKDPERRLADGAAFLAAVEAVQAGRPIDPPLTTAAVPAAATAAVPAAPRARGTTATAPTRRRRASGSTRPPARRRSGRLGVAVFLLPLLGLLAGAAVAAIVLQGLAGGGSTTAEAAQQRDEEATVVLEAADYVGRPADEVVDELAALGLQVQRETRQTDAVAAGLVAAVEPTGTELAPGDSVVVVVAQAPDRSGPGAGGTSDAGDQPAEVAAVRTAPGTATRTSATTSEETSARTSAQGTAARGEETTAHEGTVEEVDETPAADTPAEGTPEGEAPAEGSAEGESGTQEEAPPAGDTAGETTAEETTAEETTAEETTAEETTAEQTRAEQATSEQATSEQATSEQAMAEDTAGA